jgi:hypothetical protein
VEIRSLGRGLKVSAITYGNWLPGLDPAAHRACVQAALDAGITVFDTALIDPAHGDLADRDPAKTAQPFNIMDAWIRAEA